MREPTSHGCIFNIHSLGFNTLPDTKSIQNSGHVGCQLNTSADKTKIAGIFININILKSLLSQGKGRSQTAHTCAQNGDLQTLGCLRHFIGMRRIYEKEEFKICQRKEDSKAARSKTLIIINYNPNGVADQVSRRNCWTSITAAE